MFNITKECSYEANKGDLNDLNDDLNTLSDDLSTGNTSTPIIHVDNNQTVCNQALVEEKILSEASESSKINPKLQNSRKIHKKPR
jgi:hypothetical protein